MRWGGVFCKEMKCVGVFFCKKVDLSPQIETKLMLDLFFILHFTYLGGGRTHPTHPPAYGSDFTTPSADVTWRLSLVG